MLDQFAALQWVYDNIEAFGGDPDHITAVGQSAGSAAVYHIVNSPLTKGKIVGAIAESGLRSPFDPEALTLAENYRNLSTALDTGTAFLASRNATTVAELRNLTTAELTESLFGSTFDFGNVLDYYCMPNTYIKTLASGPANDVPLITGNTKDESGASTSTNLTVAEYVADIHSQYGNGSLATEILRLYPAANSSQADMSYNAHWRDTSRISSWEYANLWRIKSTSPMYSYYWNHAPPGQDQGAYHESEINYVLNNLYATDKPWTAVDYAIALKMNGYWANFAKTGNPNLGGSYLGGGNLTTWDQQAPQKNVTMELGDGFRSVPIASPPQIEAITSYFAEQVPI